MGAARLGFVATFMSDPMISGFTTGSAVLVVISQMPHILGIKVPQFSRPLAAPKVTVFSLERAQIDEKVEAAWPKSAPDLKFGDRGFQKEFLVSFASY